MKKGDIQVLVLDQEFPYHPDAVTKWKVCQLGIHEAIAAMIGKKTFRIVYYIDDDVIHDIVFMTKDDRTRLAKDVADEVYKLISEKAFK